MAHTSLIPGFGFVVVSSTETAALPGVGFVVLDGGTVTTPATVSFTAGLPALTTGIGSISAINAAATVAALGPLPGLTSGIGSLTVSTNSTQIVQRGAFLRFGAKLTPGYTSIRRTKGGVSAEPSVYAQGGLPENKVVTGQAKLRFGVKFTAVGQHRLLTQTAALNLGISFKHTFSSFPTGSGQTVSRPATLVIGVRAQANGIPIKQAAASMQLGVQMTAIGTATQAGGSGGTGGDLTQASITNIVNQVLFAMGATPPAGLVEAISAETLSKYNTDVVEVGPNGETLSRVEAERLVVSATAGDSFGMEAPQGAFIPAPGTTRGYYNVFKNKVRITTVSDGTPNRVVQSRDTSE